MKNEKIWVSVSEWHRKTKAVLLRKADYVLRIGTGRTSTEALRGAAKKLRELAAECTKLAKGEKK